MTTPNVVPMGARRYRMEIAAPLSPRLKVRLQRAVTQTLLHPTRCGPTLRRTVIVAAKELRACGFADERIADLFAHLIEDIAYTQALHETSIVSGNPRWAELIARVNVWTDSARSARSG
jgi:hypothetical protein